MKKTKKILISALVLLVGSVSLAGMSVANQPSTLSKLNAALKSPQHANVVLSQHDILMGYAGQDVARPNIAGDSTAA